MLLLEKFGNRVHFGSTLLLFFVWNKWKDPLNKGTSEKRRKTREVSSLVNQRHNLPFKDVYVRWLVQ
jgi:hypothetical protein